MVWYKKRQLQRGQMLLIVILVMVVALTVGLSVLTRNIINTRITTDETDSQRAFSAAEAGIERSIQTGAGIGSPVDIGDASFETEVISVAGPQVLLNDGSVVKYDDGVDVWLSDYQPTKYANQWAGTLSLLWGTDDDACQNAALEVILIYGSPTAPKTKHAVYDPCTSRKTENRFDGTVSSPSGVDTIGTVTFKHQANVVIDPAERGIIARVIPLYKPSPIGAKGSPDLPAQGSVIEAVGKAGEAQRKIRASRPFPQVPNEFFQYLLLVRD